MSYYCLGIRKIRSNYFESVFKNFSVFMGFPFFREFIILRTSAPFNPFSDIKFIDFSVTFIMSSGYVKG